MHRDLNWEAIVIIERMASLLDQVPSPASSDPRHAYSRRRSLPLDSGRVSFDAPDSVKQGMAKSDRRQPLALRADHRPSRRPPRDDAAKLSDQANGIPITEVRGVLVTNGGIHGLYIICQIADRARRRSAAADPGGPPAAGNILRLKRRSATASTKRRLAPDLGRDESGDHREGRASCI